MYAHYNAGRGCNVTCYQPQDHYHGQQYQRQRQRKNVQQYHENANQIKPKSLPCKKMICTGVCSYRNRCHYIHDARIMAPAAKGTCRKIRKTNNDENSEQKDMFYWTPMATFSGKEARHYSVPSAFSSDGAAAEKLGGSGDAVASLWHHFVEVCVAATDTQMGLAVQKGGDISLNPVTQRPRLPVFVDLSTEQNDERQQLMCGRDGMAPVALVASVPSFSSLPVATNHGLLSDANVKFVSHYGFSKMERFVQRHQSPSSVTNRSTPYFSYYDRDTASIASYRS